MYKAIIFDFGGVFSVKDDIQEFWQNNTAELDVDPEKAKKVWLPIWLKARIGEIDSNIFWEKLGTLAKMNAPDFKKYFIKYTGFREELYDYARTNLSGKYKLAIVTNQIESWLEPILKEKKFREIFEVIITSYESGMAKPDIEIYKITLEKLGVKAEECIYTDDKKENLESAKIIGMKTIEFKSCGQFIENLGQLLAQP